MNPSIPISPQCDVCGVTTLSRKTKSGYYNPTVNHYYENLSTKRLDEPCSSSCSVSAMCGLPKHEHMKTMLSNTRCQSPSSSRNSQYNDSIDPEHFTLESDTICHQEASIWELYGVKSETAKNRLKKAAHVGFQETLPMLCRRRADTKMCTDVYIGMLTPLAKSYHDWKMKLWGDLHPESLIQRSAASPTAEAAAPATSTKVPSSWTGLVTPVKTEPSATNEQVGTCNPTCSRNSPAEAETMSSNNGVGTSDPIQARNPLVVNGIAHSHPLDPHPLDVIPMDKSSLRPTRSLKQTAKRAYAPFASITSCASWREINQDQPVLQDEEHPPQLATNKDCREGIRNPTRAQNSVLEWRNKSLPMRSNLKAAQVVTPEQLPIAPQTREAWGSPVLPKCGTAEPTMSQLVDEVRGLPSDSRSTVHLNVYTDDEPPKCNIEHEGREKAIWSLYGVARPKRRVILRQVATDSTQDIISRVRRKLDQEQQFEVYLTILDSLCSGSGES
jgi:hypothetical protein